MQQHLWQLFVLAVAAAAIRRAGALHLEATREGGPPDAAKILDASSGAQDPVTIYWQLGDPGASCTDTCLGWCNEEPLQMATNETFVMSIAAQAGDACNTLLPFGHTEFPVIDTIDGSCAFARPVGDNPVCGIVPDPPAFRLCHCSARWDRGGWHLSVSSDASCTEVCGGIAGVCDEDLMDGLTTAQAVIDVAQSLGFPCDDSLIYLAQEFPAQFPTGQCAYTYRYRPTCQMTTDSRLRRLCPCVHPPEGAVAPSGIQDIEDTATAYGDPHLTTLQGEKFDINSAGLSTFLFFPRDAPVRLRVDARVAHASDGPKCRGWFITEMWVSGTAVGEEISVSTHGYSPAGGNALIVRIGSRVVKSAEQAAQATVTKKYGMGLDDNRGNMTGGRHAHRRIKFARLTLHVEGAELEFQWFTGRARMNSMNFKAAHLKAIGTAWGGILGGDDHYRVSRPPDGCERGTVYDRNVAQLTMGTTRVLIATASLG